MLLFTKRLIRPLQKLSDILSYLIYALIVCFHSDAYPLREVRAEDQSVYDSAIVSTRGHVIGSEAELYYFSFPFDQALVTIFREVCSQRLATLSTALEATLCQFLSQFDY
jgi:hypothetical protein